MNIAQVIEHVARVSHEANRYYCASIGDDSQQPWDKAPQIQRDSIVAGVTAILRNPAITPAENHQAWVDYKTAEGWVYGEKKDFDAKTHPCMVPYNNLPVEQRVKDAFFGSVVRAQLFTEGLING